jgi:signal transduction histidine kinase
VLIGVGIAVSRWAANAALLPLVRIAATAERIEANDLSQRLHAENDAGDELGRLTASFDRMLDRLQSAFAHERRFSADASHELRAPLAVLRAETELALRRDRDNEEYRRALESIAREAERLEHLVDDLLAAARVEADAADLREVDVNAIVRGVAARIETPAALKHVGIATEGTAPAAIGEPGAIERALLGVAHNAITFAPERGSVRLTMTSDADAVSVAVADSGPGFSREALEHATERFWRADGARPRGGTGLGLAIARAIVERSGGTLSIANAPGGGGLVTMRLRRSR